MEIPLRKKRILLCATGSVASVKIPKLALALAQQHYQVRILLTKSAEHFVFKVSKSYDPESWKKRWANILESVARECGSRDPVICLDEHEWKYSNVGDSVLHIELRKWADLMLIAPGSANTIAKLAQGLCDNLVTCVARAWDVRDPLIVCPAMNTLMWEHPLTLQHLNVLQNQLGYQIIDPVIKTLACGDTGQGAMASVETIVKSVAAALMDNAALLSDTQDVEEPYWCTIV
tara:strand:+ start:49 stop:744 length:696 start_codon:yes stop_codon:yes gene_type:complete